MVSQENVLEPGSPLYSRFSYEYREIEESLEVLLALARQPIS